VRDAAIGRAVSNEVGSGVVPPYPVGRHFRDALGELNQRVAAQADNVLLLVAGLPLALKCSSGASLWFFFFSS
jgi:adenosylcobinamide kinase/adenosylcobinamide-phosphate guanylyltransferase